MSVRARQLPVYDSSKFRLPLFAELADLLRYRFLVSNLVARDLKVRYKRSTLGFIWVMLNPLLIMIVLTIVFSQIFRFDIPNFPMFLLSGLLLWNLYSQGTNACMAAMQGNAQIIRKLHVPPTAFIASAIGSALVNFGFALVPFFGIALVMQVTPSVTWLYIAVPALLTTAFSFGVGLFVGGLIIFFTDTFEIYQVLLQVYYFFTPLFYPENFLDKMPEPWQTIAHYNPMYLYIHMTRVVMLQGQIPSVDTLIPGTIAAVITLVAGWMFFTRVEDKFASYVCESCRERTEH
jgi:ABC-type polysaccharide/polyol phosphate export permease